MSSCRATNANGQIKNASKLIGAILTSEDLW